MLLIDECGRVYRGSKEKLMSIRFDNEQTKDYVPSMHIPQLLTTPNDLFERTEDVYFLS
jgi:hypothetical protein